jgi:hypothetical protein
MAKVTPAHAPATQASKPAAPAAPAKPEKEKKEKVARVPYPGLLDAEGKPTVKLTSPETPADFSVRKHQPLRRNNFDTEKTFYEHLADKRAAFFRKKASDLAALGNVKDVVRAKKLIRARETLAALQAQLLAQGVSQDELNAIMSTPAPKA